MTRCVQFWTDRGVQTIYSKNNVAPTLFLKIYLVSVFAACSFERSLENVTPGPLRLGCSLAPPASMSSGNGESLGGDVVADSPEVLSCFQSSMTKQTPCIGSSHSGPDKAASWKPLTRLWSNSWNDPKESETHSASPEVTHAHRDGRSYHGTRLISKLGPLPRGPNAQMRSVAPAHFRRPAFSNDASKSDLNLRSSSRVDRLTFNCACILCIALSIGSSPGFIRSLSFSTSP